VSIKDKAEELAEAIKETEEYQELKSAESRLQLDPKAQDLVNEFQNKQQQIIQTRQSGKQVEQKTVQSLQKLQQKMEQNLTVKNLMNAQKSFEEVMKDVNETVTEALH